MAPLLTCVRHAQGYHNITHDWDVPDPDITPLGEAQSAQLASDLLSYHPIDLVVCSPLRRTISTSLIGLRDPIARVGPVIALPETQETFDVPCDTGTDASILKKEMEGKPIDLSRVKEGWNIKKGRWAPTIPEIKKRAKETRLWLRNRPETHIVLVTHGGFLHYLTEDWTDFNEAIGTGWANVEFRTYHFVEDDADNSSILETSDSRERREGKRKPLDMTEHMELEGTAKKTASM